VVGQQVESRFLLVAVFEHAPRPAHQLTAMLQERTIEFEIHILARTTAWRCLDQDPSSR